jgi:hypothetical protein
MVAEVRATVLMGHPAGALDVPALVGPLSTVRKDSRAEMQSALQSVKVAAAQLRWAPIP